MTLGTMTGSVTYARARIVDKTGLSGSYDFTLEYGGGAGIGGAISPGGAFDTADVSGGPSLFAALEKQLGLRLEKSTAKFDVLVIDHIEKTPTDN
jgi:uncharacterized protein (TIGR03435 family)